MTTEEFAQKVRDMRHLQKLYFRKKANLAECKEAEKEIDDIVESILHTAKPDLFSGAE
jgi:hypothetical protein